MVKLLKKLAVLITLLSSFTIASLAQNVTLSATVQDPNGQVFQWGTYTITFAPNPASPIPPSGYSIGGDPAQPVNLGPYTGELNTGGTFNVTLINGDNHLLTPAGSKWLLKVCPDVAAGGGTTSPCTQLLISLSGVQDISAQLNAATVPIGIFGLQPMATAYGDSEVEAHLDGTAYFRVIDRVLRCWSQGSFFDCGAGGGGGSVSIQHNDILVGTEPIINVRDSGSVVFTITDDPGNTRVDIQAASVGNATYQHNGTDVAAQPKLNFVDNGSVTYTVTNDSGNGRVNIESTAAGAGGSVFAEQLNYLYNTNCPLAGGTPCTDIIPTPYQWAQDLAFMGPLPLTYPSANVANQCAQGLSTVDVVSCHLGYVPVGDTIVLFTNAVTGIASPLAFNVSDNVGDTFTQIDYNSGTVGIPTKSMYTVSAGGDVTVTVTPVPTSTNIAIEMSVTQLHNAGAIDAHTIGTVSRSGNLATLPSITTANADDIILGSLTVYSDNENWSAGAGYAMINKIADLSIPTGNFDNLGAEVTNVSSTSIYSPTFLTPVVNWVNNQAMVVAFRNLSSTNFADPTTRIVQNPDLFLPALAPFYQARNVPLSTIFSDTLLDWHTGTPINNEGDTTDYTNIVLTTVSGGGDASFKVWAYVDCSGSVATVTPKIIYTTIASNVITLTGSVADCTSHATGLITDQTIHAKTATDIKFTTTHTGSPTWNTSAGAAQRSNQ